MTEKELLEILKHRLSRKQLYKNLPFNVAKQVEDYLKLNKEVKEWLEK